MRNFYSKLAMILNYLQRDFSIRNSPKLNKPILKIKHFFDRTTTQIDEFLQGRSKSEEYIIYILPFVIIGYLSFENILPSAQEKSQESQKKISKIVEQIKSYEEKVQTSKNQNSLLIGLRRKIEEEKKELENIKDDNLFLDQKLEENLKYLSFTRENWSQYLSQVTEEANNKNIKINNFANKIIDHTDIDNFAKILQVDINGTGSYPNMMNFLNSMENNERVVELDYLEIEGGNRLNFSIKLSVWGVK